MSTEPTEDAPALAYDVRVNALVAACRTWRESIDPRRPNGVHAAEQGILAALAAVETDWHAVQVRRLAQLMSDISEDAFAAGWLSGNEHYLWDIVQAGAAIDGGFGWYTVDAGTVATLRTYAEQLGGWVFWDDKVLDERFIPLDDWLPRHAAWQERQARARQEWEARQQG